MPTSKKATTSTSSRKTVKPVKASGIRKKTATTAKSRSTLTTKKAAIKPKPKPGNATKPRNSTDDIVARPDVDTSNVPLWLVRGSYYKTTSQAKVDSYHVKLIYGVNQDNRKKARSSRDQGIDDVSNAPEIRLSVKTRGGKRRNGFGEIYIYYVFRDDLAGKIHDSHYVSSGDGTVYVQIGMELSMYQPMLHTLQTESLTGCSMRYWLAEGGIEDRIDVEYVSLYSRNRKPK